MPDDAMFKEASDAIRKGELNRARNLFTRLLKSEPDNAQYWLWMSAVVETTKERVYCLREALRRDPQDPTIRGGLVLLGALSPQEAQVQPAPFIRRAYEIPLGNLEEPAPPAGVSRKRILFWSGGAAFFILLFIVGMLARRPPTPVTYLQAPGTPRPSATLLPTGTAVVRSPTPTFTGPTPLWMQLEATYTPTPFAINTPHPRSEAYRSGINAYEHGNWASMINFMQQVQANEPPSADIIYYIGEAYRFQCEFAAALEQYDHAIQVQPSFAPAYLGRARALLAEDPLADVSADLGQATTLDPSLGEIYLTQAESALNQDDGQAALDALKTAEEHLPGSAIIPLYRARADLILGLNPEALLEAQKANQMDFTSLPAYRVLAQANLTNAQPQPAVNALKTYLLYVSQDAQAYLMLAQGEIALQDAPAAFAALDQALKLDDRMLEAYLLRGNIYLQQNDPQNALSDYTQAAKIDPQSFAAGLGKCRAFLAAGDPVSAYQTIYRARTLATGDADMAAVYYWEAQAQDALNRTAQAEEDWKALLALPQEAFPAEWADQARQRLATPTPTLSETTPAPQETTTPTP